MKTLLTSSLIIACSAALIACGGSSSSSDNKAANNSSGGPGSGSSSGAITTSNAFKSAEGAAVAASAASGMIGMAQELATGDGFGSEEETTPASDIPAAISGDFDTDEACDVGRIRTKSGFATSRFDNNEISTEIIIAENCEHHSSIGGDNLVSTMSGRMEVGEEPSLGLSYVRATGLSNSLTEGFYSSESNFMKPLKRTMRALIETRETETESEIYAYAVLDMDMFGTKMRMNMGNSASEPLAMIATAINNDEEEIKVDGHLAAAFDEAGNCSFAVNYTTIQPLVQNLNDEDALPTAGELTIALVGDKSYNVQFDNAGILVDGELFTEENIDNSELAKECAEFMEDDDDDMFL